MNYAQQLRVNAELAQLNYSTLPAQLALFFSTNHPSSTFTVDDIPTPATLHALARLLGLLGFQTRMDTDDETDLTLYVGLPMLPTGSGQ